MGKIMRARAFALPSIMIASVVMLMVLAAAISGVATTRTALTDQYYNQVAKEAAESGLAMADACIESGTLTWPNPLRPGSGCSGAATQCDNDESCYLLQEGNVRTTFYVDAPTNPGDTSTARSVGRVELTRTSNNAVWKAYDQTISKLEQGEGRNAIWKSAIFAGGDSTCAVASDSKLYCWGANYTGQLGTGTTTNSSSPVAVNASGVLSGKTILATTVGGSHACAIASDKAAYCWGSSYYGELGNGAASGSQSPVAVTTSGALSGKTVQAIAAGNGHTCAIASDNRGYCWGLNSDGALGNGTTNQPWDPVTTPVAVNMSGALSGKTLKSIATGSTHTCVVASDNLAYCWGDGSNGRLGNNSTSMASSPVAVTTSGALSGKTIKSIAAGWSTTCALASDDQVYCWGSGADGQLGNGGTTNSSVPVAVTTSGVLAGKTVRSLSVGGASACVVASDNQAYCWGDGKLGNGSGGTSSVPVAVNASGVLSGVSIQDIYVGWYHTCALSTEGRIYCWGNNHVGQLGNSTTTNSFNPTTLSLATDASSRPSTNLPLEGGLNSMCSIASNRETYCWGNNNYGQFGNGTTNWGSDPTLSATAGPLGDKNLVDISMGNTFSCGIASNYNAYCWGQNNYGGLGDGSTSNTSTPVPVVASGALAGKTVRSIASGMQHACAIASDNRAYCWGSGSQGALGNNSTADSSVPVAVNTSGVLSGKTILALSSGGISHTCAIASDYRAYCWGTNDFRALGNNSTTSSSVPTAVYSSGVLAGKSILSISSGDYHTCALASDNQVYCWGRGNYGQLGNNSTADSAVPVAVNTSGVLAGKTIVAVGSGYYHTCALASDAQVYCWGWNTNGQLGNGSTTQANVPVAVTTSGVLSGKKILAMSRGGTHHTCVLASDNNTYCWGAIVSSNVPVQRTYTPYPAIEYRKLYF